MAVRAILFCACMLAVLGAEPSDAAPQIGLAAAVSNDVSATTGAGAKRIHVGDSVFQNQTVMTAPKSTAQFLFLDETALTVGPVSRVKLDRFVYDPGRRAGRIVVNVAKGAFRFVSGIAKSSSYRIQTPVASIAVRGTVFDAFHHGRTTIAVLVEGGIDVCAKGTSRCVAVDRPGQYAIVDGDRSVSGPHEWSGELWDVTRGIQFPLFGRRRANDFSDQTIRPLNPNDVLDTGGPAAAPGAGGGGPAIVIP